MMSTAQQIYKICRREEYEAACSQGVFAGSKDDIRDGFIHFSTLEQVSGTLSKHFSGERGLHLLEVDTAKLGEALVWEKSRGGALFPHLYGPLDMSLVEDVKSITWDGAAHVISEKEAIYE